MHIEIKRIYDEPSPKDGTRILVDRLWPRGITKERAAIDLWAKDLAPTPELRQLFHKGEIDFKTFVRKYQAELKGVSASAIDAFLSQIDRRKRLTLLYGIHDTVNNHAAVLKRVLEKKG